MTAAVRLPEGMARAAEQVVSFINAEGYGNVGVLKFRVQKQGSEGGETVGTINRDLATQLETALVIKRKQPATFVLLLDASDTAAATPGAGDATAEARDKLFAARYRPAWGDASNPVAADAFITGTVEVDRGLETMRVVVSAIKKQGEPREIASFDAVIEPALLGPLGESFSTRGMINAGLPRIPRAEQAAATTAGGPAASQIHAVSSEAASISAGDKPHPLADSTAPVTLVVAYDGKESPLEFRQGKAFVPEPREGQKVTITVRKRKAGDGRRIGVVLKVNGENTAMRERAPDLHCYKWILSDAIPAVTVRGYQVDRETIQPFTVLSTEKSQSREFSYGADVGSISVTVFDDEVTDRPAVAGPSSLAGERGAADVAMLERGVRIDSVAANGTPQQLREALVRGGIASETRGLIVEGDTTEKRNLDLVEFKPVPTPAMVAVVTYYEPRAKDSP
ncbi:MAG: hypothetical protein ACKOCX_08445 [Planctomycetota bacterium]